MSHVYIFSCHVKFWGKCTEKWDKTADFRDLLLEGAIFIVGTQKFAINDCMFYVMKCI